MVRIVLITHMLQHYRLSFYEKLSNYSDNYQLIVFHGIKKKEDGRPGYTGSTRFKNLGFRVFKFSIYQFGLVYNLGMYSQIKKVNPDIIILQDIPGDISYQMIMSWAKRKRKKVIIWTCGWKPAKVKGLMLKFKNKFVKYFFKKAQFFLTYSSNTSRYVQSIGIESSLINTCYNGIDTDDLSKNSLDTIRKSKEIIKKNNLENHITFLYVGGLIIEKKVDLLIDAFIELRKKYFNIKLIIIGDGPQKEIILNKIKEINDSNIIYLGRIISDVDSYFVAADCLVLPGIGGLALNQAMFWRKLCIVSQADGTEDDLVIENISGYRFKENDLKSLISAMDKRINENQDRLDSMSENAHQIIIKQNNVNNMVKVFSNTIDYLME